MLGERLAKRSRRLVREHVAHAASKEGGGAFTFNCRRFHRHLRERGVHLVDVSVVWSVVLGDYGGAVVEVRVRNSRRHALIDRRRLVEILRGGVGR
ncbi:MAG: hypothetical protein DRJ56_05620 [Thermoprotei archaeon]|nr:MAG: hypothetical protein DRJ56_05620 [Thermoprotei archaeon]